MKRGKHMKTTEKHIGFDDHKDTIIIVIAEGGRQGEVRQYGNPLLPIEGRGALKSTNAS